MTATAVSVCLVLVACLLFPPPAHAGPWAPEPGRGYVKLWAKWLFGLGHHDGRGHVESYGGYHEAFLATYGEVGVFPEVAVFWHTDLLRIFVLDDPESGRETHATTGDPAVGLRWQWLQGNFESPQ